jgi:predicted DsbA family dithiol-disulfide isomerase
MGIVSSFETVCSWCGAMSGSLRKCPCKMSTYCDADCQHRHWKLHKPQCPSSKSYVNIS